MNFHTGALWSGFAILLVASGLGTDSCSLVQDDTSLIQIRQLVNHGSQRSGGDSPSQYGFMAELAKLEENLRVVNGDRGEKSKVHPKRLPSNTSKVTFVATVGKAKWLFWFRRALRNMAERDAEEEAAQEEENIVHHEIAQDEAAVYAMRSDDGFPGWWRTRDDFWGLPLAWRKWRHEPWQAIVQRGLENGRRWREIAGLDWSLPWEVAAALPYDPLGPLDLWPTAGEVFAVDHDMASVIKATANYEKAKIEADEAEAESEEANEEAGLSD